MHTHGLIVAPRRAPRVVMKLLMLMMQHFLYWVLYICIRTSAQHHANGYIAIRSVALPALIGYYSLSVPIELQDEFHCGHLLSPLDIMFSAAFPLSQSLGKSIVHVAVIRSLIG